MAGSDDPDADPDHDPQHDPQRDPQHDGRDDRDLLRAHADGDPTAFPELVHRHRDRCWALAMRTLRDHEEAADAVQDALLAAHRSAGAFRGEAAVSTWLHRVVLNACLDRLRRRAARPSVPLDLDDLPAGALAAHDPGPETRWEVAEALAGLPEDQRAALVLVDLEGRPVAEAARLLGVPEGTVKSRCHRGRLRLAVTLGHLRPRASGGSRASGDSDVPAGNRTPDRDVGAAVREWGDRR